MPAPRIPVVRRLRAPFAGWLLALLALPAGGCGDPVVGGGGRFRAGRDGVPDLLVVHGSPYEMGWWQGRLLRERIRRLATRWPEAALRAVVGMAEDTHAGAAGKLREALDLYVDIALDRLPETVRQELTGLADATGLAPTALLLPEVLRDGLRVYLKELEPRLPGGLAALATGPVGEGDWSGPESGRIARELLVVVRKPTEGTATAVVAWPGALGGLAGLAASRQGFLTAEVEADPELRGFGKGVPFTIAARVAVERGGDVDRVRGGLGGTAGHAVLLLRDLDPAEEESRAATGSVEVYRGVQPALAVGELGYLVLGPDQDVRAGLARTGLATRPGLSGAALAARVFGAARRLAGGPGPRVRLAFGPARAIVLATRRRPDGPARRVVLDPAGRFETAE